MYGRDHDTSFGCVQFFNTDGVKILEAGYCGGVKREFILSDGERLIGIKAADNDCKTTYKKDLQFVIGWLE